MRILGIDPGFGLCGFAFLEKTQNQINLKKFGVIKTNQSFSFSERLEELATDFNHLLKKYQPDIVSVEDLFFVQNITTGIDVAQARGVILYLAQKFKAQIVEPKPVEVKNTFTGNGNATKPEIKKMAKIMFDLEENIKIDDAADAIAVAYYAAQKITQTI